MWLEPEPETAEIATGQPGGSTPQEVQKTKTPQGTGESQVQRGVSRGERMQSDLWNVKARRAGGNMGARAAWSGRGQEGIEGMGKW